MLPERKFTARELSTFIGKKVITTLLDNKETSSRLTSWQASWRWFSAWTNLTTLITWKMENLAMSYLSIT